MIQVIDNFFTPDIHKKIFELMLRHQWSFTGGNNFSPFWHMNGLENEDYFSDYLFNIIKNKLDLNVKIRRIYANGQTAGQNGNPHPDVIDSDNDITFIYYPNQVWKYALGGNLVFFEDNGNGIEYESIRRKYITDDSSTSIKIKQVVTYMPNRAIIFPANIWHQALEPNRSFNGLRVSLAYKLELL